MNGDVELKSSSATAVVNSDPPEKDDAPWQSIQYHFTIRAVVVGVFVGGLMSFSNMYFGLQTGWITMGSLQTSILGFLIFRVIESIQRKLHIKYTPFTPLENVCLQTTAVATATMPLAGGYVGILPALTTIGYQIPHWHLIFWSIGIAFFGVFFAVPLRTQTILREKLRFPSGTATAQMIRMLHKMDNIADVHGTKTNEQEEQKTTRLTIRMSASLDSSSDMLFKNSAVEAPVSASSELPPNDNPEDDDEWKRKLSYLGIAFACSMTMDFFVFFFPVVGGLPFFTWWHAPVVTSYGWTLTPSFSYIGQGMIMGPKTGLSMVLGAIMGWAILGPISNAKGWAPGPVSSWQTGATGWILWVALAIMLGESLSSLSIVAVKAFRAYWSTWSKKMEEEIWDDGKGEKNEVYDPAPLEHQVPRIWWLSGLAVSTIICVAVTSPMFSMPVYEPIVAVVVACLTSVLAVRALGETDLNPTSGIGKLSQIVFAGVAPGSIVSNLIAGAISEAGATEAGDMMQDLKTGHLLRASPRAQFFAQLIGAFFSVFFALAAYVLYSTAYVVPGPQLPAPTSGVWIDMAELVNGGHLPANVVYFAIGFFLLAASFPLITLVYPKAEHYLPSCIAFAVAMYNTPNWTIARAIGSLIVFIWQRRSPASFQKYMIIVASGFVLGDGITSIITAIMKTGNVKPTVPYP